ncbi:MAG: hypothetical protein UZ07_CHB004001680 [Chlorobi bacterium OLB7]|nr:MAG: hypothetical protein UZ07_CHB004001680 [Chlorobi bacterium OLB7]
MVASAGFFHARFQKYRFLLGAIRTFERVHSARSIAVATCAAAGGAMQPMPMRHVASRAFAGRLQPQHPVRRQELSDEERLNQILDQISETGYDSLSPDEQRFLREYSQRL